MALEALACQTPVICLKNSAVEELCRPPLAGRAVNYDAGALSELVKDMISKPEIVQEMGLNARKIASEYSISEHVNKLVKIYSDLQSKYSKSEA
jgi:glycosyltransferase involved in cell wall biosynthesis